RVVNLMRRLKEHSRLYYFRNGGDEEIFFGSADLMPAKVNNRVEMLVPVEDPGYRRYILKTLLSGYLRDNVSATEVGADGECLPRPEVPASERFDIQAKLIEEAEANLE